MKYYTEKNSKILKFKKNRKINIYLAIIITILINTDIIQLMSILNHDREFIIS